MPEVQSQLARCEGCTGGRGKHEEHLHEEGVSAPNSRFSSAGPNSQRERSNQSKGRNHEGQPWETTVGVELVEGVQRREAAGVDEIEGNGYAAESDRAGQHLVRRFFPAAEFRERQKQQRGGDQEVES